MLPEEELYRITRISSVFNLKWKQITYSELKIICMQILERMKKIIMSICEQASSSYKKVVGKDDKIQKERKKAMDSTINVILKSVSNLSVMKNVNTIVKELQSSQLYDGDFYRELDMAPDVLGVNNGIIVFDKGSFEFIHDQYHLYKVSLSASVDFNPNVKTEEEFLLGVFKKVFIEDECFKTIFKYLSCSLVGFEAPKYMLVLLGKTLNGKSTLTQYMRSTLGDYLMS
jgi:phage/plasmid-associated DNA primase